MHIPTTYLYILNNCENFIIIMRSGVLDEENPSPNSIEYSQGRRSVRCPRKKLRKKMQKICEERLCLQWKYVKSYGKIWTPEVFCERKQFPTDYLNKNLDDNNNQTMRSREISLGRRPILIQGEICFSFPNNAVSRSEDVHSPMGMSVKNVGYLRFAPR